MLDKFKFTRWEIAYRKEGEVKYHLIPNPPYGWCADPFLVEYQNTIYLFAEIFLWQSERNGVIGYCIYEDGKFGSWTVTMDKHWHLSYPNVFVYKDYLYMCPESYQREDVSVYKLREFPDKWEKVHTFIENEKCVDTTFMNFNNEDYFFTFNPNFIKYGGQLYLYNIKDGHINGKQHITNNKGFARPAGNIINVNGKHIRVSQDCSKSYGCGIVLSEIDNVQPSYEEHIVKRITVEDILVNSNKKFIGIHTYNQLKGIEVIDLKYLRFSLREYIAQRRVRRVFTNKY